MLFLVLCMLMVQVSFGVAVEHPIEVAVAERCDAAGASSAAGLLPFEVELHAALFSIDGLGERPTGALASKGLAAIDVLSSARARTPLSVSGGSSQHLVVDAARCATRDRLEAALNLHVPDDPGGLASLEPPCDVLRGVPRSTDTVSAGHV